MDNSINNSVNNSLSLLSVALFKILLASALVLLIAMPSQAQQKNDLIVGTGGPLVSLTSMNGNVNASFGGEGAVLINRTFMLGGFSTVGQSLLSQSALSSDATNTYSMKCNNKGFMLGYIHQAKNKIHFGLSSRIGWGDIMLKDISDGAFGEIALEDNFLSINPQFETEVNINSWAKINLGLGYQFIDGLSQSPIPSMTNSPTANIALFFDFF